MNLGRVVKYLMLGFETWKFYIQVISFDTHLDLFIKSLISNSPNTLWNWPISTQKMKFLPFFSLI